MRVWARICEKAAVIKYKRERERGRGREKGEAVFWRMSKGLGTKYTKTGGGGSGGCCASSLCENDLRPPLIQTRSQKRLR